VRTAIMRAYKKRKLPLPKEIEKIARNWHPYCSIASWYLWRSLEFAKEPEKANTKGTKRAKAAKAAKAAKR